MPGRQLHHDGRCANRQIADVVEAVPGSRGQGRDGADSGASVRGWRLVEVDNFASVSQMNLNPEEKRVVGEIVARLKHDYRAEAIFLYGSAARGQLDVESDVDLLAVLPRADWEIKKKVCDLCFQYELNLGRIVSVVCVDSADFHSPARQCSPFLLNVRKEGIEQ